MGISLNLSTAKKIMVFQTLRLETLNLILAHTLVKVPWPGDSEVTFLVLVKLPPVTSCLTIRRSRHLIN